MLISLHHHTPLNFIVSPLSQASFLYPSKSMISYLLISILALFSSYHVIAIDYIVGDEDGWATGVNYLLWSEKYNFTVGDSLVFNYVKGQHDVRRVTEDTYRSCDARSGVFDVYSSGRDRVNLTAEMSYWFICDVKGHCLGGMKFGISVGAARAEGGSGNSSNTNGAGLSPPPPPPPLPQGNGGAGDGTAWRRWLVSALTFWVIQLLR
ncbi:basic blue protein-like [Typha angustifolia]|uniref:basic blue protein-like n=1 Tax=Typha angustifolia TaxID=59011 RepID=UPI003C2B9F71